MSTPRGLRPDLAQVAAALAAQRRALADWHPDTHPPHGTSDHGADALLELLVHTRRLHERDPGDPPPYDSTALGLVTRLLAARLAAAAPGRSVEVRIPPYAAVQCVEGPRHTRGTPGSVVETDPLTWLDLATGRISWAEAAGAGRVRASGERSDLSAYLPVARRRPAQGAE